jgi:c-di-GMP-binding flagellar brake protein YcgR
MKEYYSNIHKIEMKIIKILCSYNILQYTNKLTINAIPTNIVSFLNQNVYYETINK